MPDNVVERVQNLWRPSAGGRLVRPVKQNKKLIVVVVEGLTMKCFNILANCIKLRTGKRSLKIKDAGIV